MEKTVISFELKKSKKEAFTEYYKAYKVTNNNPYVLRAYKKDGISILLYSTLSVVMQGQNCTEEGKQWGYKECNWDILCDHAGSDEVGTGDIFGPIVVASAYVEEKDHRKLIDLGINDSKKLSDQFILRVTPSLIKKYPHSILICDNVKYNEQIKKGLNMNSIKALLHNQALVHLSNKVPGIDTFVIDQFCAKDNYFKYLEQEKQVINNITFTTKGESHSPAVALASMIARYTFLIKVQELEATYGVKIPLGSQTEVSFYANQLLAEKGRTFLKKICKLNFKSFKK